MTIDGVFADVLYFNHYLLIFKSLLIIRSLLTIRQQLVIRKSFIFQEIHYDPLHPQGRQPQLLV